MVDRTQLPVADDADSTNPSESDAGPFPIVGIGMSAGGLEVATEFLKSMPPDSGMGFIFIQHLEPDRQWHTLHRRQSSPLGGDVAFDFQPAGLRATIRFPLTDAKGVGDAKKLEEEIADAYK